MTDFKPNFPISQSKLTLNRQIPQTKSWVYKREHLVGRKVGFLVMLMMMGEEAKRGRGHEGFSTLMVAVKVSWLWRRGWMSSE